MTGAATFVGGSFHSLPFLIPDVNVALTVAGVVVAAELVAIAFVRRAYMRVSLSASLVQVTLGGVAGRPGRRRRRQRLTRIFTLPAATKVSLWGCD